MRTRPPLPGLVSLVDAVLCAISIFVIMIVLTPREKTLSGELPRPHMLLSCEVRDILDFTVTISAVDRAEFRKAIRADMNTTSQQTAIAVRQALLAYLKHAPRLVSRVAVDVGKGDTFCVDHIRCALGRAPGACSIRGIEPWHLPDGASIPVVTYNYDPKG